MSSMKNNFQDSATKLNAPPLQHALLLGWVWQSSVPRQDVATHQVLSCRGYNRRLLAVELEALLGYRRGATAGLLAWATKDSDQARIAGSVAYWKASKTNASPPCSRLCMLGCCEKLLQVWGPTDSFFKRVDSTTGVFLDPVWATGAHQSLLHAVRASCPYFRHKIQRGGRVACSCGP